MAIKPKDTTALSWSSMMQRGSREPLDSTMINYSYTDFLWELNQRAGAPSDVSYTKGTNKGGSGRFYVGMITSVPYVRDGKNNTNKIPYQPYSTDGVSHNSGADNESIWMKGPWYISYCGTDVNYRTTSTTGKYAFNPDGLGNTYYADRILLKRELDYILDSDYVHKRQLGTYYTGVGMWWDSWNTVNNGGSRAYLENNREVPDGVYFPTSSYAEIFNDYAYNKSTGSYSHAEGYHTYIINAYAAHAEGVYTIVNGAYGHAEGANTLSHGTYAHAEGKSTRANGTQSHAEGLSTNAEGSAAHSEGNGTHAQGNYTHAEGSKVYANGESSHAEGNSTYALGVNSHSEGQASYSSGIASHAEGYNSYANKNYSHTEGNHTTANGVAAHAEGANSTASGINSHAEGNTTTASGNDSHTEGNTTTASNVYAHAEGHNTTASGESSHAEGNGTQAKKNYSHTEGNSTIADGESAHAEGHNTTASGESSHAEGKSTRANGLNSHSEGNVTIASGLNSHSEGDHTNTSNPNTHSEGYYTNATMFSAHAEGAYTYAVGAYTHTQGFGTYATNAYEATTGVHNMCYGDNVHGGTIFTIGNGTAYTNKHNLFGAFKDGTIEIEGPHTYIHNTSSTYINTNEYHVDAGDTSFNFTRFHQHVTGEVCIKSDTGAYFKGVQTTYIGKDKEGNYSTYTTITSKSGGSIEIDANGQYHIDVIQGAKEDFHNNLITNVTNGETHTVTSGGHTTSITGGENHMVTSGGLITSISGGETHTVVSGGRTTYITGDEVTTVSETRTTTINGIETQNYKDSKSTYITGNCYEYTSRNSGLYIHGTSNTRVDQTNTLSVGTNNITNIGGTDTMTVAGSQTITVTGNETQKYNNKLSTSISTGETHTVTNGGRATYITGLEDQYYNSSKKTTIKGTDTISVSSNRSTTIEGTDTTSVTGNVSFKTIGSASTITVSTLSTYIDSKHNIIAPAASRGVVNGNYSLSMGSSNKVNSDNSLSVGISNTLGGQPNTVAFGNNLTIGASTYSKEVIGHYNLSYQNSVFEVGVGTNDSTRKNALWIDGQYGVSYFSMQPYTYDSYINSVTYGSGKKYEPSQYPDQSLVVSMSYFRLAYQGIYDTLDRKFNIISNSGESMKSLDKIDFNLTNNVLHYTTTKYDDANNKYVDNKNHTITFNPVTYTTAGVMTGPQLKEIIDRLTYLERWTVWQSGLAGNTSTYLWSGTLADFNKLATKPTDTTFIVTN